MVQQEVLKPNHDLKGKDVLPIVQKLQELSCEQWENYPGPWASLSHGDSLEKYSAEDLDAKFLILTGYDIKVNMFLKFLNYKH